MLAEVLIEYSVKSLDKTFDYIIPEKIKDLKLGQKVLVPFGKSIVEGFVLNIKPYKESDLKYKEIIEIKEKEFCLNKELLELGKYIKKTTLSTLISAYQAMFPKALKASSKTKINIKSKTVCFLNSCIDIDNYINNNKRNKKEIEIINILKDKEIDKSKINSPSLKNLIDKNIVITKEVEVKRDVNYLDVEKKDIVLTLEQKKCYDEILNSDNSVILLYGVTGSGKTAIYINLIKKMINEGKTAIMLVPEISLTPQIVGRFKNEFSSSVAVLHSGLSEGEKYDEYRRIVNSDVKIVIGARSAVFAPLKNIGIIIIDECASTSFKQDVNPKYNAIDIAIERAKTHNALVVLGSATPLLEQYARAVKGVYKLVTLDKRISGLNPKINLVDMNNEAKKRNYVISSVLKDKITECLKNKKQVILLLNRRGYSTYLSCASCGFVWKCPNCDISLIYHKSVNNLKCHYCGYQTKMTKKCPKCGEEAIKDLGLGTEKLEKLINDMFPSAKTIRMDLDTTTTKNAHQKIISAFEKHEYDILIGTQMVSKGLNFKDVSLVGVLNIDASLNLPDFRSSERTFELLMQTAGRTARYDVLGEVVIETYNVDNYVFRCLKNNSYVDFYNTEMSLRKKLKYPPYFYIVSIKISSPEYEIAKYESNRIKRHLSTSLNNDYIILGPSTASILKLNNKYYFQIIIKYKKEGELFNVLKNINDVYISDKVKVDININPLNLI